MSEKLVYDSPVWNGLLRGLGRLFLWAGGWTVVGRVPDVPKFIAVAAPHTSNWDFPLFISVVFYLRLRVRFMGKHTLFKGMLGALMTWLGGIPVNRDKPRARAMIDQVKGIFLASDQMIFGIAPEGTRSQVTKWKTGFYRIAVAVEVPILLAFVDSRTKTIGIDSLFHPTGDMEADLRAIQAIYADKVGVNPANQ